MTTEKPDLITIADSLTAASAFVEAIHMAAQAVRDEQGEAIAWVALAADEKLRAAQGALLAIMQEQKGEAA